MPHIVDPWAVVSIRVEDAQDAIIGESLDGVVVRWNAGAVTLLGYGVEDVIGRSASRLSAGALHTGDIPWRLKAGERIRPFESEMVRKDGRVVAVSVVISPVFDEAERLIGLAKIVRALDGPAAEAALRRSETRRRQLEQEIAHLGRWSAMGQMAIALAHELNQPLTAIVIYLTSARRLLYAKQQTDLLALVGAMDRANDQARRAAKIIGRLRSFVSPSDPERRPVSIAAMIRDGSDLALIAARQAGIIVDFRIAEDAIVLADHVQIQQVIFNLMRNAVEAMAETPVRELRVSTARRDEHIVVSVSDSGSGIPAEISARLFQPFVTTKSEGMGVGLSICRAIINAHGGEMWLDDASSPGATFHLKLPLAPETN